MDFSKVDQFLDLMPERGIPACDVAVTYKGKPVYRHSVGFADVEKTRPVSANDLYYVFSISKVTTCVTAMRLVEEGKIGLDDPVSKYLPAYTHLTVKNASGKPEPAKNVMTIRHLFTMTGGLNYNLATPSLVRVLQDPNANTLQVVNALAEGMLDFEPGTRYQYSLCHDVLAAVVEVVTGVRFADYVKQIMFDPLGMKSTGFHLPAELMPRMSAQYAYTNGLMTATPVECKNNYIFHDNYDSGGAGLYSCVDDQIRLMTVLANGGKTEDGYSLLRPETIKLMQVNQLPDCARPQFGGARLFGYGWGLCGRVHMDPVKSASRSAIGEFGWDGAAGAFALVDPEKQIAMYYGMHVRGCQYGYHYVHPTLRNMIYEVIEG